MPVETTAARCSIGLGVAQQRNCPDFPEPSSYVREIETAARELAPNVAASSLRASCLLRSTENVNNRPCMPDELERE